jgi:hypothetical protein
MRGLFAVMLLVGFVWMARWWILGILSIIALAAVLWRLSSWLADWDDAERAKRDALIEQHAWVLAGDDRGIYGEYIPKQFD